MFSFIITNTIPVLVSASTLLGVVVHDTRFDQFATTFLVVPATLATYEGVRSIDPHTHIERISVSQFTRSVVSDSPRIQPRQDEKKYRLDKNVVKGHHPFDNYSLPVVA